jgi:hypothetical protein
MVKTGRRKRDFTPKALVIWKNTKASACHLNKNSFSDGAILPSGSICILNATGIQERTES